MVPATPEVGAGRRDEGLSLGKSPVGIVPADYPGALARLTDVGVDGNYRRFELRMLESNVAALRAVNAPASPLKDSDYPIAGEIARELRTHAGTGNLRRTTPTGTSLPRSRMLST